MRGIATQGAAGVVWLDDELVPWEQARLHVGSFGLHNASCVFDGIRVYDGAPFALRPHCRRLLSSAAALGLPLPHTVEEIERLVQTTVAANRHSDAYVRPVAWRGEEVIGIDPHGTSVHLAIMTLPWPRPRSAHPGPGVSLALSRWRRPPASSLPAGAKAACQYVTSGLALAEAAAAGCDDALLLDQQGNIADATGANVFLVLDGALRTPVADAILDGITRQTVIALAPELGLPVHEERLPPDAVQRADELFLTGTACEILPVREAMGRLLPRTRPVTEALFAAYRRLTTTV